MLSRELSSPHLNADGHTSTTLSTFARAIHKGSSIVCGNTRRNSCVNVAHFYQVTCAPVLYKETRPGTLYLILYSLALRLRVRFAEGRGVQTT